MNLFSLFLNGALGWGIGKILDVVVRCFTCGEQKDNRIGNIQYNNFYCPNCHEESNQFTNACDFTINQANLEIGQGLICPDGQKWRWVTQGGGLFTPGEQRIQIPHFIRIVGLQGRDLVLKTEIRSYETSTLVTEHSSLICASYHDTLWNDHWHDFGTGSFKDFEEKIFTVDSIVTSEYKDIICQHRRIIKPWE